MLLIFEMLYLDSVDLPFGDNPRLLGQLFVKGLKFVPVVDAVVVDWMAGGGELALFVPVAQSKGRDPEILRRFFDCQIFFVTHL